MRSATVHPQNDLPNDEIFFQGRSSGSKLSKYLTIFAMTCAALLVVLTIIIVPIVLTSKEKRDPIVENVANSTTTTSAVELFSAPTDVLGSENITTSNSARAIVTTRGQQTVGSGRTIRYTSSKPEMTISTSMMHTTNKLVTNIPTVKSSTSSIGFTSNPTTSSSIRFIVLNSANDSMISVFNTTAGEMTRNFDSMSEWQNSSLRYAMDNWTSTSYLSGESIDKSNLSLSTDGVDSGFIVVPSVHNATVACGIRFATSNFTSFYDPIRVTLEGSKHANMTTLLFNNTWTLIYNGSTGINHTHDPPRRSFVQQQNFDNTKPFSSYRLLITEKRDNQTGPIGYSEAQIIGYIP